MHHRQFEWTSDFSAKVYTYQGVIMHDNADPQDFPTLLCMQSRKQSDCAGWMAR